MIDHPTQCQMVCIISKSGLAKDKDARCPETGTRKLDGLWFCWVHALTYELKSRRFEVVR